VLHQIGLYSTFFIFDFLMPISKIAYQGIPGSFTYQAAQEYFKDNVEFIGKNSFREIFSSINSGETEFAVLPIENSLAGSVFESYDLLWENDVNVIGEVFHKVVHNLIALPTGDSSGKKLSAESRINGLLKVYSHPKALEQCSRFFDKNPHIEKVLYSDTASAAKMVSEKSDKTLAAIASYEAAKLYGLEILAEHLEDNPHNITRFLVITKDKVREEGANKGSLIFTLPHIPQSLFRAMQILSQEKINVTKIESRPIHGKPFEYVFYVDFEFTENQVDFAKKMIEEFQKLVPSCRMLGFFKAAKL